MLGRLWTPWIPGWGSPHTSLAWMCALGFGDPPPMEEGGAALAPPTSAGSRWAAEGESCFSGTRGTHPEG